jgi:hypothetical protein
LDTLPLPTFQIECLCEISNWIIIESGIKCIVGIYFVLWNHVEVKKIFISECVFVANLDHAVMTLPAIWGQHDIRDMVRYKDVIKEYSLGSNEEILTFERGEDATIRTKTALHHVFVPHCVADINIGPE